MTIYLNKRHFVYFENILHNIFISHHTKMSKTTFILELTMNALRLKNDIYIQMKKRDVFFVSLKLWTIKSTLFCSPFNFNSKWFEAVWSSPCFISLDSSHRSLDVYSTLIYLRLYTTSRYSNLLGLNNLGINYFFMLATHY